MAKKFILKNCYIEVDGVPFSEFTSSVELSMKKAAVDTTNFSGGGKETQAGLSDDEITITFQQDFAAASVDEVLYGLYAAEDEFVVKVRPTADPVSATNPEYSATCILLEYQPVSGKVGDLSETKVKFPTQRTGITRAIA